MRRVSMSGLGEHLLLPSSAKLYLWQWRVGNSSVQLGFSLSPLFAVICISFGTSEVGG
jgi:hypothetical protein